MNDVMAETAKPVDLNGRPWHPRYWECVVQAIDAKAKKMLCERDISRGVPGAGNCLATADASGTYRVGEPMARLLHTGKDVCELRRKMLDDFCFEPRDPEVALEELGIDIGSISILEEDRRLDKIETAVRVLSGVNKWK